MSMLWKTSIRDAVERGVTNRMKKLKFSILQLLKDASMIRPAKEGTATDNWLMITQLLLFKSESSREHYLKALAVIYVEVAQLPNYHLNQGLEFHL
jgi:hypothetical protein